jgi:Sugar (and other) transporter
VYLLACAAWLPLFASITDIFGRHPALQISLIFFFVGNAISTAAQSMTMLLVGRGFAGIGAAGLQAVIITCPSPFFARALTIVSGHPYHPCRLGCDQRKSMAKHCGFYYLWPCIHGRPNPRWCPRVCLLPLGLRDQVSNSPLQSCNSPLMSS